MKILEWYSKRYSNKNHQPNINDKNQYVTESVQITPAHQLDKEDASGRLFLCQRIVELTLDRPQAA